jgi:hypothetical protein
MTALRKAAMICPGGRTVNAAWLYVAALIVILCLVFTFYAAKTRPAAPAAPKGAPLQHAK